MASLLLMLSGHPWSSLATVSDLLIRGDQDKLKGGICGHQYESGVCPLINHSLYDAWIIEKSRTWFFFWDFT